MTKQKEQGSEHFATARSTNLPISTKQSVEIARLIRNKPLEKSKNMLKLVLQKKMAVPYKRYNKDTPHRKGNIASGRFPQKATKYFLKLMDSAQANAENKGLDVKKLVISEIVPTLGTRESHHGTRNLGRIMKKTHLRIKVEEK